MQRARDHGTNPTAASPWPPLDVHAWVARQLNCPPGELRQMRRIELAPGVREFRYLRGGQSAVVATVARQQPGRYRVRVAWSGGTVEASIRGRLES